MAFLLILLQILKWLGIILGGLVGLVLLIVLLLLFVPFRYRVSGQKYEDASAKARVSWLLHLVRFNVDWNGGKEIIYKLKILFFTVMDSTKEDDSEEDELSDEEFDKKIEEELGMDVPEQDNTDSSETALQHAEASANPKADEIPTPDKDYEPPMLTYEDTDVILEYNGQGDKAQLKQERKAARDAKKLQKAEEKAAGKLQKAEKKQARAEQKLNKAELRARKKEAKQQKKADRKNKLQESLLKIKDKIVHILGIPKRIYEKLKHKADVLRDFLEDEKNKKGIALCKKILVKALKAIAPRRGSGKLTIGTGDPSSTGYAMAGLAVLYAKLKGKLKVTPDFEQKIIEGEGKLKGRIYLITLLVLFCKLWFNKNFKALKESASGLKERLNED